VTDVDDRGVPADLFVEVVEALEVAADELDTINGTDAEAWPVPDDLQALLDQRVAVLAVLTRLRQADPRKLGRLTSEAWQQRLEQAYVEELAAAHADYTMPGIPVIPETLQQVEHIRETVRRRALSDPALADAIRQIEPKGWAW
jgi:hypothetical protein